MRSDQPRPRLLDVNALIALFDSAHVHHVAAHEWFTTAAPRGWRTCPLTENGLLRILSHPSYPNGPVPMLDLAVRLEELKAQWRSYAFWQDDFSTSEWVASRTLNIPSSRLTDAYLLKLAAIQHGTLATFDLRIEPALIGERKATILEHVPVF